MYLVRLTDEFVTETDLFRLLGLKFVETDPNPNSEDEKPINHVGDCTVCAVSSILKIPYDDAYKMLSEQGANNRLMMNDMRVVSMVCERFGYTSYQITARPKITFASFMSYYRFGRFLLADGDHIFAYVDGVIYDRVRMRFYDTTMLGKRLVCVITDTDISGICDRLITR